MVHWDSRRASPSFCGGTSLGLTTSRYTVGLLTCAKGPTRADNEESFRDENGSGYGRPEQMTLMADAPGKPTFDSNKLLASDRAVHDWYRFVLSFPPHLVRRYLKSFGLGAASVVLDPFCGTGTTLVEARKLGIASLGVEANPMAHLAASAKVGWTIDPSGLLFHSEAVAALALRRLAADGLTDDSCEGAYSTLRGLSYQQQSLLLKDSISPAPLHKALVLLEALDDLKETVFYDHQRVALAQAVVSKSSNLTFGPEVGVGKPKPAAPVVRPWLENIKRMAADLRLLPTRNAASSSVVRRDARDIADLVAPGSVDAVFTSPPYPNEKDYTRTTRLESVLLNLIPDKAALRLLKQGLVRSNTRSVYKTDEDDRWVEGFAEIQKIASDIEKRRLELNKTSGFERMYPRLTKMYFGGMARHLANLRPVLRPGALLAYVVGDQASYLRVMIRTGQLLAKIAESLGYQIEGIDLFRTRLATATREQLREEVLVLRWPGFHAVTD